VEKGRRPPRARPTLSPGNAYGANTARLRAIKKHVGPRNFFRINPNILSA